MYEPNPSDDKPAPDSLVWSRFGAPPAGKNGSGPTKVPEQYRFSTDVGGRPAAGEVTIEGDFTAGPDSGPRRLTPPSAVSRPDLHHPSPPDTHHNGRHERSGESEEERRRVSRAERRRAAAQDLPDEDGYAATHSADLSRIASFLRSTQQEYSEPVPPPPPKTPEDPHREADTSELPTVPPQTVTASELTSEAVLNAVRQVPGVAGARLNEHDNKLALEIAEGADTDVVHRNVVAILDSHLGVRARPATPAVAAKPAPEPEPRRETQRPGRMPTSGRVMLERTQVITSGFESTVEVGLMVNGNRAVGRSTGPAVDRHILRAAADATVDAVGVLLGKDARVVVESATIQDTGAGRVAVVLVLLMTQAGAEQLAGAAPVDTDRRQAVVHATLQALNRRLEAMLS